MLPEEALQELRVAERDTIHLAETPQDSLLMTPERPRFKERMGIAESIMHRHRNALRELAK